MAIKIPEVDDMMARAQQKVDAIRQAKQKVGELKPIEEVVFAQNVRKYNPEWEHSLNGRATSYLVTLVCHYMCNVVCFRPSAMKKSQMQYFSIKIVYSLGIYSRIGN